MDSALKPQEDLLDCQQSWTSYFFGPGAASAVFFLFEGLPCLPQEPLGAFFSLAQDWALARVQQEAEEGEEEKGSLGAQTYWPLGGRRLVPRLHELPQTWARFWSHLFCFVI